METNLAMEDSWQTLLDNSEVHTHRLRVEEAPVAPALYTQMAIFFPSMHLFYSLKKSVIYNLTG